MIVTLTFMGCPFRIYSLFMDIQNSFKDIYKWILDSHKSFMDIHKSFLDSRKSFFDIYKSFLDIHKSVEYWISINRCMDIQKWIMDIHQYKPILGYP